MSVKKEDKKYFLLFLLVFGLLLFNFKNNYYFVDKFGLSYLISLFTIIIVYVFLRNILPLKELFIFIVFFFFTVRVPMLNVIKIFGDIEIYDDLDSRGKVHT